MDLVLAASLEALPPGCAALFPPDPLADAAWYRASAAHALPDDSDACFAVLLEASRPRAIVPLRRDKGRPGGLTTPYSCVYWPLLGGQIAPDQARAAGRRFAAFCRAWPTVRLDAIPAEWPLLAPFLEGVRAAGLRVQRFEHFGNWHEPVEGRSWADYLAERQGGLRETVRRKLRRSGVTTRLERYDRPDTVERGIEAFEAVYRASWKQPEPYPRFNAALMRAAAAQGTLRLGVLWAGTVAVAAQFWVVAGGRATVLKLAHDEAFKALSPGTVLTALMIRDLLDVEHVDELDFGRGNDAYKALWTTQRRLRIGVLLINPWRPAGLLALARGLASRLRKVTRR